MNVLMQSPRSPGIHRETLFYSASKCLPFPRWKETMRMQNLTSSHCAYLSNVSKTLRSLILLYEGYRGRPFPPDRFVGRRNCSSKAHELRTYTKNWADSQISKKYYGGSHIGRIILVRILHCWCYYCLRAKIVNTKPNSKHGPLVGLC